ncbi:MAG TPA: hypothetical protein VGL11_06055 [Candidatus Binatia bacterium]|jgi:hypothetical protein
MTSKTVNWRSYAIGIVGAFLLVFVSAAAAANWVPLKDPRFDHLCVDFDSIRTENGWTIYHMTYCSGMHGGGPAQIVNYSVACGEFLSTGNVNVMLYADGWKPKEADRVDRLSTELVCKR